MSDPPGADGQRSRWSVRKLLVPNVSKAVGIASIRDGHRLIQFLWNEVQVARKANRTRSGRARPSLSSDIATEANLRGLSPIEVEMRIGRRRKETRRAAMFGGLIGAIAFGGWTWNMVMAGPSGARWMLTSLEFLPFEAAALLHAFYNGWINWQLRRGRRGSAMEYLTTSEGFWPS